VTRDWGESISDDHDLLPLHMRRQKSTPNQYKGPLGPDRQLPARTAEQGVSNGNDGTHHDNSAGRPSTANGRCCLPAGLREFWRTLWGRSSNEQYSRYFPVEAGRNPKGTIVPFQTSMPVQSDLPQDADYWCWRQQLGVRRSDTASFAGGSWTVLALASDSPGLLPSYPTIAARWCRSSQACTITTRARAVQLNTVKCSRCVTRRRLLARGPRMSTVRTATTQVNLLLDLLNAQRWALELALTKFEPGHAAAPNQSAPRRSVGLGQLHFSPAR